MNQHEANKIFEGTQADLPARFANVAKICFLSFTFSPILPMALIMGAFGLALEGLVFKYLLLNVYTRPKKYNSDLIVGAIKCLPLIILAYCIGITFTYLFVFNDLFMRCLILCFTFVCVFYVMFIYFEFCSPISAKMLFKNVARSNETNDYFNCIGKFQSDYERENPLTTKEGWDRWLNYMNDQNESKYMRISN